MNNIKYNTTLVVSSCDKYEDAWYPYFELVKKYWKGHPTQIVLITETKNFICDGLDIKIYNQKNKGETWSERLYNCLSNIDTKYIIFSLEDFFLLGNVDDAAVEQCYTWMEENENIAVCRLCSSEQKDLIKVDRYGDFRIADASIGYRLDTQVALWRREDLMDFIDIKENPWEFETIGTERAKSSDKIFLWHFCESLDDIDNRVFPYQIFQRYGYGIAWGNWLWNNKKWFQANGINKVNFVRLGFLSEKAVARRFQHLYNKDKTFLDKIIAPFWKLFIKIKKVKQNICTLGILRGLDESWKSR